MRTNKPDIFLGVTLVMLVLAVVFCILIEINRGEANETLSSSSETDTAVHTSTVSSDSIAEPPASSTEFFSNPGTPIELDAIDEAGLKAALDKAIGSLNSEWQVVVIDPARSSQIASAVNCTPDDWMTANRMTQVFLMATIFQQAKDGKLTLEAVLDDVKEMIINHDLAAADRLTEMVGDGDAAKGRDAVKTFAVNNDLKLGYNRPLSGTSDQKNYATAQQTAALLNKLCRGELVSEASSAQMLELLLSAQDLDLDPGITTEGAKWGFVTDVEDGTCICAMGVVKLPHRSFVISVVCNKPVTTDGAKKKVAELIALAESFFAG